MTYFWNLSLTLKIIIAVFATISSTFAVCVSINACMRHRGWRYTTFSLISAAVSTALLIGISDVFTAIDANVSPSLSARFVGEMPYAVILLLILLCVACSFELIYSEQTSHAERITPGAVKEAFDILPDGICFATEEGLPLLVNVRMNRLCAALTGGSLTNAKRFWNDLYAEQFRTVAENKATSPSPVLALSDGTVWDFQRHIVDVNGQSVCELLAFEVTAQYRLNRELKARNDRLAAVGERLRRLTGEVEQLTREKEILSARIKVHDDVGRLLLSLRAYLEKPEEERDRKALLPLWRYTASVLRRKEDTTNPYDYERIASDASAIGVTITRSGEFRGIPTDPLTRKILMTALRECVSNTVKHAHGDKLDFLLTKSGGLLIAEFTNNGEQPHGKITEAGGLRNLRFTVENANGNMMITTKPRYILRLELPYGQSAEKGDLYV